MARPPKYATEDEKPVSVTLRIPRGLYDQAQHLAKMRQTTLTELVLEGLRLRLETPTDPRDILASQDIAVMQELKQMIAAEVQAALAAQDFHAPETTPQQKTDSNSNTQNYSNTFTKTSGTAPGQNKLTPLQAAEMRGKRAAGTPIKTLMEEYGVSRATVHRYLQ
jgi:hypothetical protein